MRKVKVLENYKMKFVNVRYRTIDLDKDEGFTCGCGGDEHDIFIERFGCGCFCHY